MSVKIEAQDHVFGPADAPVQIVEYGDYECPYTARAHAALVDLDRRNPGKLRIAYRYLPLLDMHPSAEIAAEAAEAAAAQGKFWEMHAALFGNQDDLSLETLTTLAGELGLDVERFTRDMEARQYRPKVMADLEQAKRDGAHGTPTFFINGERYQGDSDEGSLGAAIERALS